MGTLIPVPYMGTIKPASGIIVSSGLTTINGNKVGYYNASGNNPPLYYARLVSGYSYRAIYMSYSRGAVIVSTDSATNPATTYVLNSTIEDTITIYYNQNSSSNIEINTDDNFDNFASAVDAFKSLAPPEGSMNIKYSIQNGSVIGPGWISPNGNVTAYVTMEAGFNLTQQDISVTRNGTVIPFAYSNGVLTFTAPSS